MYSSGTGGQWIVLGLYIFWPVIVSVLVAVVLIVTGLTLVRDRDRDAKRREGRSESNGSSIKGSMDRGD